MITEEKEKFLNDMKNKVAWSGCCFIAAFCGFLYLLGFSAHDDYLHWVLMAIILFLKPALILAVAYLGGILINDFVKLLIELKKI